jgi:hypothetical protein
MGNKTSGVGKAWQVALTELREGLVGNPLKSIIEVIAGGRRVEPGCPRGPHSVHT